jgi:hypothetical protein
MMMTVDDDGKLYKIENYPDLSFQNFSSQIFFILNFFGLFKTSWGWEGGGGGAGWCRNMKVKRKNSKIEF